MSRVSLNSTVIHSDNQVGLELLAELHQAAFSPQDERPWLAGDFRDILTTAGASARIYSAGDKPVGYLLLRTILDEAELISIAVLPTSQGQGYAKEMMREAISRIKRSGAERLFLEVREDNRKALKLYYAMNFEKISERKDYYRTLSGLKLSAEVLSLDLE